MPYLPILLFLFASACAERNTFKRTENVEQPASLSSNECENTTRSRLASKPLVLMIVLDRSGSTRKVIGTIRDNLTRMVSNMQSSAKKVFIGFVGFVDEVVDVELPQPPNDLKKKINGWTVLRDRDLKRENYETQEAGLLGLAKAIEILGQHAEKRQAILYISDQVAYGKNGPRDFSTRNVEKLFEDLGTKPLFFTSLPNKKTPLFNNHATSLSDFNLQMSEESPRRQMGDLRKGADLIGEDLDFPLTATALVEEIGHGVIDTIITETCEKSAAGSAANNL